MLTNHWIRGLCLLTVYFSMIFLAGCSGPQKKLIGMPNPASVHCIDQGGISKMEKDALGNTYGVCVFKDNRQCEQWALFRGECPVIE